VILVRKLLGHGTNGKTEIMSQVLVQLVI